MKKKAKQGGSQIYIRFVSLVCFRESKLLSVIHLSHQDCLHGPHKFLIRFWASRNSHLEAKVLEGTNRCSGHATQAVLPGPQVTFCAWVWKPHAHFAPRGEDFWAGSRVPMIATGPMQAPTLQPQVHSSHTLWVLMNNHSTIANASNWNHKGINLLHNIVSIALSSASIMSIVCNRSIEMWPKQQWGPSLDKQILLVGVAQNPWKCIWNFTLHLEGWNQCIAAAELLIIAKLHALGHIKQKEFGIPAGPCKGVRLQGMSQHDRGICCVYFSHCSGVALHVPLGSTSSNNLVVIWHLPGDWCLWSQVLATSILRIWLIYLFNKSWLLVFDCWIPSCRWSHLMNEVPHWCEMNWVEIYGKRGSKVFSTPPLCDPGPRGSSKENDTLFKGQSSMRSKPCVVAAFETENSGRVATSSGRVRTAAMLSLVAEDLFAVKPCAGGCVQRMPSPHAIDQVHSTKCWWTALALLRLYAKLEPCVNLRSHMCLF